MLNEGDIAPDFELAADDGTTVTLDALLAKGPLILYFYPADFTPICTREACGIRDMHQEIDAAGYTVVGVSPQAPDSHARFRQRHELPFALLFDENKRVIRAFGVDGFLGFGVRRTTFVIGTDKVIRARLVADLSAASHTGFIAKTVAKTVAQRNSGA